MNYNSDFNLRVISDQVRFGCGFRIFNGKKQYFAWHGYPNRNDDYFTTSQISEIEYEKINIEYPKQVSADRETADVFRKKYVDDHLVILEGWNRLPDKIKKEDSASVIRGLSCIFPVPDIMETTGFYVSKLDFTAVGYLDSNEPHVCLYRDDVEIILLKAEKGRVLPNRELYGYGYDAYLYTDDQKKLQDLFLSREVKIVRPLNTTDYHNSEFVIEDIDGRWLAFGLKICAEQYSRI